MVQLWKRNIGNKEEWGELNSIYLLTDNKDAVGFYKQKKLETNDLWIRWYNLS